MEDLQSLLEKINREGIEKAESEAKSIIDAAKAEAAKLTESAKAESAKAKADGEQAAADYLNRSRETLAQAARDTVLEVEKSVTALLEKLLAKKVDAALADPAVAASVAAEAVKSLAGPGEIACGAKLAAALAAALAAEKDFTVVTDETLGTGFSVKTDGGRVEHSFTGATVSAELAKRLRPDLAALLK